VAPFRHLEWNVKYAPGKLEAKGLYHGQPVQAVLETTGAPAAIRLTPDRSVLAADNADLAVIGVAVVDAQGRIVPIADNPITFTVTGPAKLIGVGNGDPASHEPDKSASRCAFNGLAQALVQTTFERGRISIKAQSPGLKTASVSLESR
jgi:beta-galactosidase